MAVAVASWVLPVSTSKMMRTATQRQLESVRQFLRTLAMRTSEAGGESLRSNALNVQVATRHMGNVFRPLASSRTGSAPGRDDDVRSTLENVAAVIARVAAFGDPAPIAYPATASEARELIDSLAESVHSLAEFLGGAASRKRRGASNHTPSGSAWPAGAGQLELLAESLLHEVNSTTWAERSALLARIEESLRGLGERTGMPAEDELRSKNEAR